MYKKITKSLEVSMMVGNWFASGYRTIDSRHKISGWKRINNNLRFCGDWVKSTYRKMESLIK